MTEIKNLAFAISLAMGLGSAFAIAEEEKQSTASAVAKNEKGENLYIFNLNEASAAGISKKTLAFEPKAKKISELDEGDDFRSWQSPEVRALVKGLESDYGIVAVTMTSWLGKSFSAYVNEGTLEKMKSDSRILSFEISTLNEGGLSSWSDSTEGGEIVSWGKKAVRANDGITTTVPVYVLDSGVLPHTELNYTELPVNLGIRVGGYQHATHVAGIIGAQRNNSGVRGINPGSPIISVNIGGSADQTYMAMDMILRDSEDKGVFGILNISSNGREYTLNGNSLGGQKVHFGKRIRSLSTRLLVVESAGNTSMGRIPTDACEVSYSYYLDNLRPNPVDGVLVVSGIDENGAMGVGLDNSNTDLGNVKVNDGPCVEVWAPGARIWSTWENNTVQYLSGTSMAAPHISALAARYGDKTTRPPEREAYIRNKTFATGYNDTKGIPIRVHGYTVPVQKPIPSRLKPIAVTTSGGTGDPTTAYDGKYLSGNFWNAGAQTGFIQFDLGSAKQIKSLRLVPAKSPSTVPRTRHEVYVGDNLNNLAMVSTITDPAAEDLNVIAAELSATGRYIRIVTTESPGSWLSWREIEIYGN